MLSSPSRNRSSASANKGIQVNFLSNASSSSSSTSASTSPTPFSTPMVHSGGPGGGGGRMDIAEISILLEHQQRLTSHIESLNHQLNFIKEKKKSDEEKHHQNTERLTKQVTNLSNLYNKAKEEKEDIYGELLEKNRNLETSLVHLSSAEVSSNLPLSSSFIFCALFLGRSKALYVGEILKTVSYPS
jgi:hypothetical protein